MRDWYLQWGVFSRLGVGATIDGNTLYETCAGSNYSGSPLPDVVVNTAILSQTFYFAEEELEEVSKIWQKYFLL